MGRLLAGVELRVVAVCVRMMVAVDDFLLGMERVVLRIQTGVGCRVAAVHPGVDAAFMVPIQDSMEGSFLCRICAVKRGVNRVRYGVVPSGMEGIEEGVVEGFSLRITCMQGAVKRIEVRMELGMSGIQNRCVNESVNGWVRVVNNGVDGIQGRVDSARVISVQEGVNSRFLKGIRAVKLRVQDGVGCVKTAGVVGVQNGVKIRFFFRIGAVTYPVLSVFQIVKERVETVRERVKFGDVVSVGVEMKHLIGSILLEMEDVVQYSLV